MSENMVNELNNLNIENHNDDEDIVDPWNVVSKSEKGIDYDKLISMWYFVLFFECFHYIINDFRKIW